MILEYCDVNVHFCDYNETLFNPPNLWGNSFRRVAYQIFYVGGSNSNQLIVLKQSDPFLLTRKSSSQWRKGWLHSIKYWLQQCRVTKNPPSPRVDFRIVVDANVHFCDYNETLFSPLNFWWNSFTRVAFQISYILASNSKPLMMLKQSDPFLRTRKRSPQWRKCWLHSLK